MQNREIKKLVRPIQAVRYVKSVDLAKIVTLALASTSVAHVETQQIFATAEDDDPKEAIIRFTTVHLTILFRGPGKKRAKLAELDRIILESAAKNGSFEGTYLFDVTAEAREAIWDPMGPGPLGFRDRVWDRRSQLIA